MKVRLSQRMAATASGRLLVLVTVAVFIGFLGSTWLSQRRDDPRARRAIERGVRTLTRVRRMVDGLLEFARSGAHPAGDFEADVRGVVEGVRADAEERRIELRIEAFPPCAVRCSAGVLTSLVSNLVRNAIKYMGNSEIRRITISVSDRGDSWRTIVRDTGPGIPEEKRVVLFEPYVRGHSGEPGIGLGLATVKRLAEAHGGRVGVEAEPGRGAAFWFELPKAPVSAAPMQLRA